MILEKDIPQLKKKSSKIIIALRKLFPHTKIALEYGNNWQLLVAVVLSAQCTDKKVNEVTPALFKKYPRLEDYVKAGKTVKGIKEFEKNIHSCGFYRAKTKSILGAAKAVREIFNGKLPHTMKDMITIPGIGRKSANVILGNAYGVVEGIAVDTHVMRLSRVLGLSKEKTPEKIEQDLMKIIPQKDWFEATYLLIDYGRKYCFARPHQHNLCPLSKVQPYLPRGEALRGIRRKG
ncbi:MAG: endonuclease III [Patescibacteria group bacterium]|nr:endonuclease III [Patescibacteria group bacterium]